MPTDRSFYAVLLPPFLPSSVHILSYPDATLPFYFLHGTYQHTNSLHMFPLPYSHFSYSLSLNYLALFNSFFPLGLPLFLPLTNHFPPPPFLRPRPLSRANFPFLLPPLSSSPQGKPISYPFTSTPPTFLSFLSSLSLSILTHQSLSHTFTSPSHIYLLTPSSFHYKPCISQHSFPMSSPLYLHIVSSAIFYFSLLFRSRLLASHTQTSTTPYIYNPFSKAPDRPPLSLSPRP